MSSTSVEKPRKPKRAPSWLDRLRAAIAERGLHFTFAPSSDLAPREQIEALARSLLSGTGEASARALAAALLESLQTLNPDQRIGFYEFLVTAFEPDQANLQEAARAYLETPSPKNAAAIARAAEPPRQELLRRINMAEGGTAALISLRQSVLGLLGSHPELQPLDDDLRHLLLSWFNRGFLELRRIDWRTPAFILEKLIAYEAVHAIAGWPDLRRRLAPDRRCFAFFHPALPDEPLIFVEVALTRGLTGSIATLIEASDEDAEDTSFAADTAIFYSISNCQRGLRGISFGNFLIKQVVAELQAELPNLRQFSTLSPIPSLRGAIRRVLADAAGGWTTEAERMAIAAAGGSKIEAGHDGRDLENLLESRPWWEDSALAEALRVPVLRIAARYLTGTFGIGEAGRAELCDPVAKFHLGNGPRLERLNWMGNLSPRGIAESFGIMVNYLYDPAAIEARHEAFLHEGAIARSAAIEHMLALPTPKTFKSLMAIARS